MSVTFSITISGADRFIALLISRYSAESFLKTIKSYSANEVPSQFHAIGMSSTVCITNNKNSYCRMYNFLIPSMFCLLNWHNILFFALISVTIIYFCKINKHIFLKKIVETKFDKILLNTV